MEQINKDTIRELGKLDDEQFRATLKKIASSAGLGDIYTDIILKNSSKVKRKLMSLDEKDIKAVTEKLGDEKIAEILSQIKKG